MKRAGSPMPVWICARFSRGSGRKCSHVVMQESSAASCSQRRMHELPMHQKIPSIQTGVRCNSASTLILSVATIWGVEGLSCVTCSHRAGNLPALHHGIPPAALWMPAGTVLSWASSPASHKGNLGIYFPGGFLDSSQQCHLVTPSH